MQEYSKQYHIQQNRNVIDEVEGALILFDYDIHKPEICKGAAQTFLIYEHLYYHFLHECFNDVNNSTQTQQPPSLMTWVEGKPGTGKSFATKTLRNITRMITQRNSSDLVSAPTGCAAALINATTHNRCSSIPIGNAFQRSPINLTSADPNKVTAMQIQFCRALLQMMDEHSMNDRAMFAWLRHRCEEARRPVHIIDEEGNILVHGQSSLPQEVCKKCFVLKNIGKDKATKCIAHVITGNKNSDESVLAIQVIHFTTIHCKASHLRFQMG